MTTATRTNERKVSQAPEHAGAVVRLSTMPLDLKQALLDFGLMSVFRALTPGQKRDMVWGVIGAKSGLDRRERIAFVLDDLALRDASKDLQLVERTQPCSCHA